jgi:hypothetical protein
MCLEAFQRSRPLFRILVSVSHHHPRFEEFKDSMNVPFLILSGHRAGRGGKLEGFFLLGLKNYQA